METSKYINLCEELLEMFNFKRPAQLLVIKLIVHLCFRQYRWDVFAALETEIVEIFKGRMYSDDFKFYKSGLEEVFGSV